MSAVDALTEIYMSLPTNTTRNDRNECMKGINSQQLRSIQPKSDPLLKNLKTMWFDQFELIHSLPVPAQQTDLLAVSAEQDVVQTYLDTSLCSNDDPPLTPSSVEGAIRNIETTTIPHRRGMIECPCICAKCEIDAGMLIVKNPFAKQEQLAKICTNFSITFNVVCFKCKDYAGRNEIQLDNRTRICCDICKSQFMSMISAKVESINSGMGIDMDYKPLFDSNGSEKLCQSCNLKYRFCSECGGGGRFKTGKYRPREFFGRTKRTCNLPHYRIGNSVPSIEFISAFEHDLLQKLKQNYFDIMFSLYGQPSVMDEEPFNGSFNAMNSYIGHLWSTTIEYTYNNITSFDELRMFFVSAKISRNQKRKRNENAQDDAWNHGVALCIYNTKDKMLYFIQLVCRSMYSHPFDSIALMINQAKSYVSTLLMSPVNHTFLWIDYKTPAKIQQFFERHSTCSAEQMKPSFMSPDAIGRFLAVQTEPVQSTNIKKRKRK